MTTEPEPYRLTEHQKKVQREEIRLQSQADGHHLVITSYGIMNRDLLGFIP